MSDEAEDNNLKPFYQLTFSSGKILNFRSRLPPEQLTEYLKQNKNIFNISTFKDFSKNYFINQKPKKP